MVCQSHADGEAVSRPSVAVVGTGIAGMAAGYLLRRNFDVTFYEKQARPGGHTNTVTVQEDGRPVPIDTGFIVYNEQTYPNLLRFFRELEIPVQPASMSFSVSNLPLGLEYCGTGWDGLFAQRRNLANLRFWKLLFEINRFNTQCLETLENPAYQNISLSDYAAEKKFSRDFLDLYLVPMSSAVWSTPPDLMLEFPAASLVRFFRNHGLLGMKDHLQWYTVTGGSRVYRDKVLGMFAGNVMIGNGAAEVRREGAKVSVTDALGRKILYDRAVMAGHADETLAVLKDASPLETRLLSKFKYQKNHAVLHTDISCMPKARRAWSSWNYVIRKAEANRFSAATVYWMNSLQNVSHKKDYFVSIDDPGYIKPETVLWEGDYTHPLFDLDAVRAQDELPALNKDGRVFFCGSYFRYGFHEDAFTAAAGAARALAGENIW